RVTVVNPGNVNVTVYVPGRKSTMRYRPPSSVTAERSCSINAGLFASTVTPGNTAPDVSATTPVTAAPVWAAAIAGTKRRRITPIKSRVNARMASLLNRKSENTFSGVGQTISGNKFAGQVRSGRI